jgi:hypothetical protein
LKDAIFDSNNFSFEVSTDDFFGDHKSLLLSVLNKNQSQTPRPSYYTIKKINHPRIIAQNLMSRLSDTQFDEFQTGLKEVLQENTRICKFKERFHKPFMNVETLNLIQIRTNYFRL